MSLSRTQDWLRSQNRFEDGRSEVRSIVKAKTISITSGKGGVGKTSLTIKFGKALAHAGHRVLVLDCDYNLSNTFIKLNLPVSNNFYAFISNEKPFDKCLYKENNFHLLSGCNGNIDFVNRNIAFEKIIINIINEHELEYDYILLDSPAGIGRENLILNAYTDFRFVIVTPDKSSITDSYSLIKILKNKYGIKNFHLLVNKVDGSSQYKRIIKSLSETVDHFLNCRLKILCGIENINLIGDKFDSLMAKNGHTEIDRKIIKVLKKFYEEGGEPHLYEGGGLLKNREQEVLKTLS